MGLTHNHQLPFPEGEDAPDIPAALAELAERLENVFTELELRLSRLEATFERAYEAGDLTRREEPR